MSPTPREPAAIADWHAHVYFDAARRDAAWALRQAVAARFGEVVRIGRFNEGPVGPHPVGSYELAVRPEAFAELLPWLVLNHGELDCFIHPNTGALLRDHTEGALWLGRQHALHLTALDEGPG